MNTVAVMQPYLLPYIGYFQLIRAVDQFVVYDDVQYIARGWMNRNYCLLKGQKHLFTFSVQNAPQTEFIYNRFFTENFEQEVRRFFQTLQCWYQKAPFYQKTMRLLEDIFHTPERNLAKFNTASLQKITHYLGIETPFLISSELPHDPERRGEARILDLLAHLKAERYINAIGGLSLYSKAHFKAAGIELQFLKTQPFPYAQFSEAFVENLSIVDVLMFNSRSHLQQALNAYELI